MERKKYLMGRWGQYCIVPLSSSGYVYNGRWNTGQSKAWSLVWTVAHRQCIPVLGCAYQIQALNGSISPWCSWGWSMLQTQVLLGPCWEMAWVWAFSLSYAASHPKLVPDTGFTPNRLGLGEAGACERTWVHIQVWRGAMACAVSGKMHRTLGHQKPFQTWYRSVKKGSCSGKLLQFLPRFPLG